MRVADPLDLTDSGVRTDSDGRKFYAIQSERALNLCDVELAWAYAHQHGVELRIQRARTRPEEGLDHGRIRAI